MQEGIAVVPVDLDNNGKADKKELFYKDIFEVQRAAYLGKYPSVLCQGVFLVTLGSPSKPGIKEFLEWVLTQGQPIAEKEGDARLRRCQAKTSKNKIV